MLLKPCHILSVGESHRGSVCTILLNSNKVFWSTFQNTVVPPHCFNAGSEESFLFHLQTTSKFISEIRASFPMEFKGLCDLMWGKELLASRTAFKKPLMSSCRADGPRWLAEVLGCLYLNYRVICWKLKEEVSTWERLVCGNRDANTNTL